MRVVMIPPIRILLLGCMAILAACRERGAGAAEEVRAVADRDSIVLATLWVGETEFGAPIAIMRTGAHLVVVDALGDSMVTVLDPQSGGLRSRFGRRGEGPGELAGAWSLSRDTSDSDVWVYDIRLARMTRFTLTQAGVPQDTLMVNVRLPAAVVDLKRMAKGFVALGLFGGGRVAVMSADGHVIRYGGAVPVVERAEALPASVVQHAYQGMIGVGPLGTSLVVANRHASLIELRNAAGELIREIEGPVRFRPVFSVRERGGQPALATGGELRFGYLGVVVLQDRIMALYSGRRRDEFPGRASFGRHVHVFTYGGILTAAAVLPRDAIAMTLSEEDSVLYIAVHEPEPAILALDAAPLLRSH